MTIVRGPILDRLRPDRNFTGNRVFYIDQISDDRFVIVEACDEYFSEQLSRDELKALGQEIIDAATRLT